MQILVGLILLVLVAAFFPVIIWLFGAALLGIAKDFTSLEFWVMVAVVAYALTIFAPSKKK